MTRTHASRRLFVAVAVAVVLPAVARSAAVPAGRYRILTEQSQVVFVARKWSLFEISGIFKAHRGEIRFDPSDPAQCSIEWEIDTASVATGEDDRDRALRSRAFLDADEHPHLRFRSSSVRFLDSSTLDISGTLEIRGVSRPWHGTARVLGFTALPADGEVGGFSTEFTLDRRDFDVLGGAISQQMIADDVRIRLTAGAVRVAP